MNTTSLSTSLSPEPTPPISLRLGMLYKGDVGHLLMPFINDHIQTCKLKCEDKKCIYFKWFFDHNRVCKQQDSCSSCSKLKKWVWLHVGCCQTPSQCPLDHLCGDMKKLQLKGSFLERDKSVENILHRLSSHSGSDYQRNREKTHTTQNGNVSHTHAQNGNGNNFHAAQYGNEISSQYTWNQNGISPSFVDQRNEPPVSIKGYVTPSYKEILTHDVPSSSHPLPSSYSNGSLNHTPDLLPPPLPPIGSRAALHGTTLTPPQEGTLTHPQGGTLPSPQGGTLPSPQGGTLTHHHLPSPSRDMTSSLSSMSVAMQQQNPSDLFSSNSPSSFLRRSSNSSTTSVRSREKRKLVEDAILEINHQYLGGGGGSIEEDNETDHMTLDQQRDLIRRLNSSFRRWSEDDNLSQFELTSQASFGDVVISRLESQFSSGSSFSSSSPESSVRSGRLEPNSSVEWNEGYSRNLHQGGPRRRKITSLHKLEKMLNVESFEDPAALDHPHAQRPVHRSINSQDGAPVLDPPHAQRPVHRSINSQDGAPVLDPPHAQRPVHRSINSQDGAPVLDSPPVHRPVQRQASEGIRKYVRVAVTRTSKGSSLTSSPHHLSDEEEEEAGADMNGCGGRSSTSEEDVSYPIQRTESISEGDHDKFVLNRMSISRRHYQTIKEFQERNMPYLKKQDHAHDHTQQQQQRNSYDISEISSSPPLSLGSNSQFSSLGEESSDNGNSVGGPPDGKIVKDPSSIQCHFNNAPSHLNLHDRTPSADDHTPSTVGCNSDLSLTSGKSKSHDHASMSCDCTPLSHLPGGNSIQWSSNGSCDHSCSHGNGCSHGDYCRRGDSGHAEKVLDSHIFASPTDSNSSSFFSDMSSHTHNDSDCHTHNDSYSGSSDLGMDTSLTSFDKSPSGMGGHDDHHHHHHHRHRRSMVTKEEMEEIYNTIDRVKEEYKEDIAVMKTRGRILMTQQNPEVFTEGEIAGSTLTWDKDSDGYIDIDKPSQFPEMEAHYYQVMMVPVDEGKVAEEEVNHREHLREYLLGQFHRKLVYREGTHWNRQAKLGRGGQGTCYSILDKETNLSLALKEEHENDKSIDEAYVCLKLAHDMNVSRNIAEYFGAALLPHISRRTVQLFMEIMPTCMQAHLFKNGPLQMNDVHHFSFQLFDALEYLHNRERIIHCDVKPANLLLDYTAQRMKLADFGAAELLQERRRSNDRIHGDVGAGTLAYNPPEHYSLCECSFALDSWQAGCCVLAMATGRRPWRHLFMDPSPIADKSFLNKLKRSYGALIGKEKNGHMLPAFLDSTITKVLYGCMHSDPKMRLTAIECQQLLAFSEDLNEKQKVTVSDAIGYPSATPPVLQSCSHTSASPCIDVFLGSFYEQILIDGHGHTLYPGWVGSVQHYSDMTYKDLYHVIFSALPVLRHLGYMDIAVWDSSPQEFFMATNPSHQSPSSSTCHLFHPVNRRSLVDTSKPIVLYRPS